ncbi:DUF5947 family protein [Longispora sp. K20-0274]|uniref:DUF5947 family protein n=1 Tax=Longispora sp. K20-0274 TaxID=3088255 RepID=UPI00399BB161
MTTGLRRFRAPLPPTPRVERCEMCARTLFAGHPHVVDTENRGLLCACPDCASLFALEGAAGGRYRRVPDRHLRAAGFALTDADWDALQIPVRMAFLFRNSALGRTVAFYPSPAGATESLLDVDSWDRVLAANPHLPPPADDVEAVLVRREPAGTECYLVPIDACYRLVGLVRTHWKGFDGGTEAWAAIDTFFEDLRARSRVVGTG